MREIKYRAYNPRDKKMHYDITGFEFYNNGNISGIFIDGAFFLIEEVYLMQFTGLYDKNKVPIYEGDIVRVFENELAYIYYSEDRKAWCIEAVDKEEFYFDSPYLAENISFELEVIGNIYDNPELLGEDK